MIGEKGAEMMLEDAKAGISNLVHSDRSGP
jgi:hypothetical protein